MNSPHNDPLFLPRDNDENNLTVSTSISPNRDVDDDGDHPGFLGLISFPSGVIRSITSVFHSVTQVPCHTGSDTDDAMLTRNNGHEEETREDLAAETLWTRLGGNETVTRFITIVLQKCEQDPRISNFFDATKMPLLKLKHCAFASSVLGGPYRYSGKGINDVHRRLVQKHGLNEEHFDVFGELLLASLKEIGAPDDLARDVAASYYSWKDCVLSRGEWAS